MDKKVLGLDVSMNNVLAMTKFDSFQQLVDIIANHVFLNTIGVLFKNFEQVLLEVFEDQVQAVASKQ